jgi:hypothetical protein
MKPNFSEMSLAELRAYVKEHRSDDEAIHELFVNRRNPNAKQYPPPLGEESIRIMEQAFQEKLGLPQHGE